MPFMSSLHLQIPNPLLDNQFSMSGFTRNGRDGDLQEVVRGFNNSFSSYTTMDYPQTCFSPLMIEEDGAFFCSFPDFCERNTVLDELEELYKPFYPTLNPFSSVSGEERELETVQEKEAFPGSPVISPPAPAVATPSRAVKYKRRKTQHKRVTVEVTAEGISSDVWAWRKYGQKPIKGSPYPRSYYRCSSSKGCLARKQVERSQSDSQMFVITYTAEHCHGHPSRKSSLAGTTRKEFSHFKSVTPAGYPKPPISLPPPIASLVMEKKRIGEEEEDMGEASKMNGLDTFDVLLSDDLFFCFDELDRPTSDITCNN